MSERTIFGKNEISSMDAVEEAISSGDANIFFVQLAKAGLQPNNIRYAISGFALEMERRSKEAAVAVAKSVRGVEYLTGDNSFERTRAEEYKQLSQDILKS